MRSVTCWVLVAICAATCAAQAATTRLADETDRLAFQSWFTKVTTPGTFPAMPARISPMYVPGVSASSDVMTIAITDGGTK